MVRRQLPGIVMAALALLLVASGTTAAEFATRAPAATLAPPAPVVLGSSVVGLGHLTGTATPQPFENDAAYRQLLVDHFASLTPENQLKWEAVHPERDRYDFGPADAIVEFAEEQGMALRGHTLLWHNQNPGWLTAGDFTDDELREVLREHITTVVGRYAGRIDEWDVVNELFDDSGHLRTANPFVGRLGIAIVADALRWAHEADPDAVLFLNDYNVESVGPKSDAYLELASDLLADGVPLGGFGVQGHLALQYPFPSTLAANLRRFGDLGLDVAITELDVRMELDGEPTDEQSAHQSDVYRQVVEACLAVETCTSVTVWGTPDQYSWVPAFFPGQGAASLIREDLTPKPAYDAVIEVLQAGRG